MVMRVNVLKTSKTGGGFKTEFVADPSGSHLISFSTGIQDGWGRRVG